MKVVPLLFFLHKKAGAVQIAHQKNGAFFHALFSSPLVYLCKQLTPSSLPEIGRRFGGKHHSTVIHAIQKIEKKRAAENDFNNLVDHFMQSLS